MGKFYLHIDESGNSSPTYQPTHPYILVGCVIDAQKKDILASKANNIKNKYFGSSEVVLHSLDIAANAKDFKIFKGNLALKNAFLNELLSLIRTAPIVAFVAIIDKTKIRGTWTEETVVRITARSVFFNFISFLYSRKKPKSLVYPKGEIIIEAATSTKDIHYLKAFSYFLSPACKYLDKDFGNANSVRKVISSISFVTKDNNDVETQIADLLGYAANCKYAKDIDGKVYPKNSYEAKLISALEARLFKMPMATGTLKRKFFSKVNAFQIFPKK